MPLKCVELVCEIFDAYNNADSRRMDIQVAVMFKLCDKSGS